MDTAKRIPQAGALAVALGLGVAIATGHGVATAAPEDSGTSSENASSDSGTSSAGSSTGSSDSGATSTGPNASSSGTGTSTSGSPTTSSGTSGSTDPSSAAEPDETSSEDVDSETPTSTDDASGTPPTSAEPAPEVEVEVPTVPSVETESTDDSDRNGNDPVQPSPVAAASVNANRSAASSQATSETPSDDDVDGGVTSAIATQSVSSAPSVTVLSAAASTPPVTQTAPAGPLDGVISGFLSLIAAPFMPGILQSGGTGTPVSPFGSLLELVFAAQRRVQSFFFNQPPTAAPVQMAPTAEGVIVGTVVAVDPEGDPLSYTITRPPTSGTVTIDELGRYTYTPNPGFALTGGTDEFGVVVRDNGFNLRTIVASVLSLFGAPTDGFGTSVTVPVTVLPMSPPATGPLVFAVTTTGQLISFTPSAPQTILSSRTITGLSSNEAILGIDYRPANGKLYALGNGGKLYTLDEVTGAATAVSTLAADPTDTTAPFTALPGGATFGIDFNPVPDRLRVIEDAANLRINVDTGATTTDSNLVPVGDYFAAAYLNSFPTPPNTALYALDATANTLVSIGSVPAVAGACPGASGNPNCGVVTVIGPLNVDAGNVGGFDIAGPTNNFVLAAFQVGSGGTSSLYRIDLSTGAATLVGEIGTATDAPVTGLAIRAI